MPGRPLTILQLTHQGGESGSTVAIANLSRQLARHGHRVLIGCRPGTMLAGLARDAGLEIVPLDFRRLGPLAAALGDVIVREDVDVANSNATRDRRALTWLRWPRRPPRAFGAALRRGSRRGAGGPGRSRRPARGARAGPPQGPAHPAGGPRGPAAAGRGRVRGHRG